MTGISPLPDADPAPVVGPSRRLRLALLAARAAQGTAGVSGLVADPRGVHATVSPSGTLPGVGITALPGGRFEVALHLRSELVPLYPLGDRVRKEITRVAVEAGLGSALGPISVEFEDVSHPLAHPVSS